MAWTKGQSGNPAGRPLGSKHKLGKEFIAALAADFEQHGAAVIARVREEKPDQYLKVVASVMPKDINVSTDPFDGVSDEELEAMIRHIRRELAAQGINLSEVPEAEVAEGDDEDATKH